MNRRGINVSFFVVSENLIISNLTIYINKIRHISEIFKEFSIDNELVVVFLCANKV